MKQKVIIVSADFNKQVENFNFVLPPQKKMKNLR